MKKILATLFILVTVSAVAQTNQAWLNASRLAVGYVPAPRLGTNFAAATDGMLLVLSGDKVKYVDPSATISLTNLPSFVTTQGNAFNSASTLLQLDGSGLIAAARLPASVPLLSSRNTFSADQKVSGGLEVTGSVTNDAWTASTLLSANATKVATSIANSAGFLYNDGAGAFSFTTTPKCSWSTNGVSAAAAFPVGTNVVYSLTNAAGAITYTSVSGTDPNLVTMGSQIIDANGADRTLTLPANWKVPDGVRSITVTNGTIGTLSLLVFANKYTNAFYRCGY